MLRRPVAACLLALVAAACVLPTIAVADPDVLARLERQDRNDLARLRAADLPIVLETNRGLFLLGTDADLARAARLGYETAIVDLEARDARYVMVGLTEYSDRALVESYGVVVWEEENWLLLRLPLGVALDGLHPARVFLAPVPREPLAVPRDVPEASVERRDAPAPDPIVEKIVGDVEDDQIHAYWVDLTDNPPTGTRFSRSQGCRDASTYCLDEFGSLGLDAEFHEWAAEHAPNVVGEITGAVDPDQIYIAIAHLDDLPSSGPAPGADDNASGSVYVLEAARTMSCWSFRKTVRFIQVTGEEQGLLGSDAYAAEAKARGDDIRAVINMDMPGWEGNGTPDPEDLDLAYNGPSEWLGLHYRDVAERYETGLVVDAFYCPSMTASDHQSFWKRGYHAIMGITDAHGYCGHSGTYPEYHTSDDTIENCGDPAFFYSTVRASVAAVAELAEPFKITFGQPAYGCGSDLALVVGDRDLDTDPSVVEQVVVEVWSATEATPELVTLTEESASSSLFRATVPTTDDPPVAGDGVLSVAPGDPVHAEYVDAFDCDGAADVAYRADAHIDCTGPVISNVHETDVSDVAATIRWTTDETADGLVVWGETTPPDQQAPEAGERTEHAVPLDGLSECTVYYYEVRSTDVAGNLSRADNGGSFFHFETLGDFGSGLQPCHEGRVTLDEPVSSCSDTVSFDLVDMDLNRDADVAETAVVTVTSSTEVDPEQVVVTETGPNTSRFTGSITTAGGSPAPDGLLQAAHGDVITVTYRDADDGTGAASLSYDTADADCAGPAITDLRVTALTNARATVAWSTSEPADTVLEWGRTPALGETVTAPGLVTDHAVVLNDFASCETAYLRVRGTDEHGNTTVADELGTPHAFASALIPGLYWYENFEQGPGGWILGGEWEIGPPQGLGGSSGREDPSAAYNNDAVLGHDLAGQGAWPGDYEPGTNELARMPSQDASTWESTELLVHRRLNAGAGDDASLWLWTGSGVPLYRSEGDPVSEANFQVLRYDVAARVDGQPSVRLEFRQSASSSGQYSGWNVDDVIFKDGRLPDYQACGGCSEPPSFVGLTGVSDDDACAPGSVTLSWPRAVAWGSGNDGTYAIWRGDEDGFVPGPDRLVASGVGALSWTDTGAPADTDVYYLVRAENDETCGSGPDHGGLTDDNAVYLPGRDATSQPLPEEVEGLDVALLDDVHVRLAWTGAPGADRYRVQRALAPQPDEFAPLGEADGLLYDDLHAGADAETYFYLVLGLDACGREGP